MERSFCRIGEVAEIVGLGKSFARWLVVEGKIPSVRLVEVRGRRALAASLERRIEKPSQGGS